MGSWGSAATAPDWQLVCMGTLEVHQDQIVFLGKVATERIPYAEVLGLRRTAAVNQWGAVLPEFARVVLHRSSRGPVALSCTHAVADLIEASVEAFQQPAAAVAAPTSSFAAARAKALGTTAEGEVDWGHPVFRGTIVASTGQGEDADWPLGCAATLSFSEDGVTVLCTGFPARHLLWEEITALAYSGDRYDYPVGGGDLPRYETLLQAGIHQGRARVLVADAVDEWVFDAAWVPLHKDLLDAIDCMWNDYSDLEPR